MSRRLTLVAIALAALSGSNVQGLEFTGGQATWYPSIYQGSCGYFNNVPQFIAAWPDVQEGYNGICGRCFAVECRPTVVKNAPGPWPPIELPRTTVCKPDIEVVVKITDTCPCKGNEQWCCNKPGPHLDLSNFAFAALVNNGDIGQGIIGINFREVSCDFIGVQPKGKAIAVGGGVAGQSFSTTQPPPAAPAAPEAPAPPKEEPSKAEAPKAEAPPQAPPANTPEPAKQEPAQPAPAAPAAPQGPQGAQAVVGDLLGNVAGGLPPLPPLPPLPAPPADGQKAPAGGAHSSAGASAQPSPSGALPPRGAPLPKFAQCGGMTGACQGDLCQDRLFDGYSCDAGLKCVRQNRYFYQCLEEGTPLSADWKTAAPSRPANAPDGSACTSWPLLNEQCGGTGGACGAKGDCADRPFKGACCSEGACRRTDGSAGTWWECRY